MRAIEGMSSLEESWQESFPSYYYMGLRDLLATSILWAISLSPKLPSPICRIPKAQGSNVINVECRQVWRYDAK